jgi:branched-chain amino acid transport system ATP-binding protein
MRMSLLEIINLHAGYGKIKVLSDISLHVDQGEIVTILGSNGAGKSTLLRTISALVPVTAGLVRYNDKVISAGPPHAIACAGVAHVPEGRGIFGNLTVLENLKLAFFANPKCGPKEKQRLLELVFEKFPVLKDRSAQQAVTLSGGEQQMLAVGRAMAANGKLFIFDEPSLGLSPKFVTHIFSIISDLQKSGKTILLVEQNATMALSISSRAYVLENGRIVAHGTSAEIANDGRLKEAYLG